MTEILSAEKLSEVVRLLLTKPTIAGESTATDAYARFLTQIAQAVCGFYDSDVNDPHTSVNAKAWFVAINGNRLPQPTDSNANSRCDSACLFWQELLDSVESLTTIVDQHGARTLVDLFYLQNAILCDGYIDHLPGESHVLHVVRSLFSAARWERYIKVEDHASVSGNLDFG